MSELRESIRNVIDDIPSTLSKVKDYIKVFEDSPEIHKCSADLYVVCSFRSPPPLISAGD